jgi:5'-nucleotidase
MLSQFQKAGKKVFLLTNSLWDYTMVVMNYLEGRKKNEKMDMKWTEFFDVIIVGGNKPAFLVDDKGSLTLFRIDAATGMLANIDTLPRSRNEADEILNKGKCFQGGNAAILHTLLSIKSGDRLLYVGDHVYADVLRSKRTLGWRTCLIIPELTGEIMSNKRQRDTRVKLVQLRSQQFALENEKDVLHDASPDKIDDVELALDVQLSAVRVEIQSILQTYNEAFHPRWGPLFRAGFQESRFAKQICDYACMYTSRASNLGLVSPLRPFRPTRDRLPHDHFLETSMIDNSTFVNDI